MAIVLKTVAIAVIAGISANLCRDAGQSAAAAGVELAAAVGALYVSLPLFRSMIAMIGQLLRSGRQRRHWRFSVCCF